MSRVKHSIKKQYAVIFGLLLTGSIVLICTINALVLGTFYANHKKQVLRMSYERINLEATTGDMSSDEFRKSFRRIASMNNLDIIILDSNLDIVASTSQDSVRLSKRLKDVVFDSSIGVESVYEGNGYSIIRSKDTAMNLEFLELWGALGNDCIISIRTPMESIKDSTMVANRLMIIVGIVSTLCGVIIVTVISTRITKPIMRLVGISERMTQLDFRAKYASSGNNEIDMLGEHINQLSGALEKTISDLKSANAQLQQDIDEKTKEEERQKEFIANVSHELKTPIALIQGYAEGLKDCVNDDDESREFYCDVIMDEASRMNKMVRNLLELDQIENGINKPLYEQFDIIEVIYNCVEAMDIMLKQNDITVIMPERYPVLVWADEFKIEQIVNNYLSNAVHHATGEKIVKISCEIRNEIAVITVFNTGETISEDIIPYLWDKFYKADKARTRAYGGSGIGLSIVKAIMEQTGMGYGVKNRENGVEFFFEVDASTKLPSGEQMNNL